jgi:hypothetical protein
LFALTALGVLRGLQSGAGLGDTISHTGSTAAVIGVIAAVFVCLWATWAVQVATADQQYGGERSRAPLRPPSRRYGAGVAKMAADKAELKNLMRPNGGITPREIPAPPTEAGPI